MRCNSARCPSSIAARARWSCRTCAPPRGRTAPPSVCGFIRRTSSTRICATQVDGQAERDGDGVAVELKEPGEKKLDLKNELVFPTEHVRRIIAAAREGKTLLQLSVYDGSDTGEKLYDTLTVIGKAIAPDEQKPTDAAAGQAAFAGMTRWPVTISYFDHGSPRPRQASRRRSMPSPSSFTRTASRAR